jgi:hypothetical protein
MTEAEIEANAQTDEDNPPLRTDELARFHRVLAMVGKYASGVTDVSEDHDRIH